jgi:hypothetical protein
MTSTSSIPWPGSKCRRPSVSPSHPVGDILLSAELEGFNFRELPTGTPFGLVNRGTEICLDVRDENGLDVAARFFHVEEGELRLSTPVMPSMLTRDEAVIRQDCLCYLMERYNDHVPHRA